MAKSANVSVRRGVMQARHEPISIADHDYAVQWQPRDVRCGCSVWASPSINLLQKKSIAGEAACDCLRGWSSSTRRSLRLGSSPHRPPAQL
jgi:hypothetical protein